LPPIAASGIAEDDSWSIDEKCQVVGTGRGKKGKEVRTFLAVGEAFNSAQGKVLQHPIKRLLKVSNILSFHQHMGYRDHQRKMREC
jgi:hypothetical protein